VESPQPVVVREWLDAPCLVLPLDFDCMVVADVIETCDVFLSDDLEQYRYYRGHGHFGAWGEPSASVGEALRRGTSAHEAVCCNLGVGALDAAVAAAVLSAAERGGIGMELPR
jgi:hypothetical protein